MKNLALSFLLLICLSAVSQKDISPEDVHASLVQGKKKSLIAYAGKEHSFTMEITSPNVKPSDIPGFITINKQIVQSTLLPASKASGMNALTPSKEKEALLNYMNYELGYYRKKLKQDYSHLQTEWISLQGRTFLLWYFDMPKNYKLVSRQIYLSTLFYDQVMDLNAPVFKLNDFAKAKETVLKLAGTFKVYDKQINPDQISRQLNK